MGGVDRKSGSLGIDSDSVVGLLRAEKVSDTNGTVAYGARTYS
jgi:hypothetical protein